MLPGQIRGPVEAARIDHRHDAHPVTGGLELIPALTANQAGERAESGEFEIQVGASSRDIRAQRSVTLQSTEKLNYRFSEFSFFREFWSNPELRPLLIELMPNWVHSHVGDGQPPEQAAIQDFILDQPLIKFPYFTGGEVDAGQIRAFVEQCNSMTFTP